MQKFERLKINFDQGEQEAELVFSAEMGNWEIRTRSKKGIWVCFPLNGETFEERETELKNWLENQAKNLTTEVIETFSQLDTLVFKDQTPVGYKNQYARPPVIPRK